MSLLGIRAVKRGYKSYSDTELMVELGDGNDRGLEEIVRRYQRPLVGYLAQIINDSERARDLAQETFIRIFRHAAGYRTTTRFATWLYHIARNIARDELRARKRRPELTSDEAVRSESTESERRHTELRETVTTILARMSKRDRRLLVLRDLKGLSYEEISTQTGMALGTVKSGLSRARDRFRDHYESLNAR
ncbi:MAG: sigma-70 family RNA polymerase sigma factor [Planctomycetota bacterium]|nr:sigma-70 family RNA polymerase sigma factor [Planctomycetota bacterium]